MKNIVKKIVVELLWRVMGRRNLARFARFITNEVRLDVINNMERNGELLVQDIALDIGSKNKDAKFNIFDAGANVGDWTCRLLESADIHNMKSLKTYSFEPCKATYSKLIKNLEMHTNSKNVTAVNAGLSDAEGSAFLNVVGDGAGTNSLHKHIDLSISREEEIKLTTVDVFCKENNIKRIVLLKIDTEGHDLSVIQGAEEMLKGGAIDMIQFEYTHRWITSGHFLRDAFIMLKPLGYRIGKITPRGVEFYDEWHYELESFREGNYLACKHAYVDRFPLIKWWNS